MMITLHLIQQKYRDTLRSYYSEDEIRTMVHILLEEYLGVTHTQLLLMPSDAPLDSRVEQRLNVALRRLLSQEPIQYILGHAPFGDLDLKVASGVLIPRPETEELCAMIVEQQSGRSPLRILDLGTGSGCIALYLADKLPQAQLFALEKNEAPVRVAQSNFSQYAGVGCAPQLIQGDMLCGASWVDQLPPLDIIVSNPPYIQPKESVSMEPHVLDHEPFDALFAPEEDPLLFYRAILDLIDQIPLSSTPSPLIYLELNALLAQETLALYLTHPRIHSAQLHPDLSGKMRFLTATIQSL